MPKYQLSKVAAAKLEQIYEYSFRNFGEEKADEYVASLEFCFSFLALNPMAGREFHDFRRHEHLRHIIFYKPGQDEVLIADIFHEKEDIIAKLSSHKK